MRDEPEIRSEFPRNGQRMARRGMIDAKNNVKT
jgi:hypothetical protein